MQEIQQLKLKLLVLEVSAITDIEISNDYINATEDDSDVTVWFKPRIIKWSNYNYCFRK